ncbi:hypothetical protein HKK80_14450 [Halonotius sp. F2-221B]|uniref:hypothetical protein n=1 Tax=Halonotius sp. F2-221B TaxID=2731620 RepID=UPI00398AC152
MSDTQNTAAVSVVVTDAPAGVRKYTARIACDADGEATIEAVEPGLLERYFEIVDGGVGAAFVRARAVDMTGEAGALSDPASLFTIRFSEAVPPASITLTFETLQDHDGETIPDEAVRFDAVG